MSTPRPWRSPRLRAFARDVPLRARATGRNLFRLDGKHPALVHLRTALWGHQIPAWYGPDGTVFVDEDEEAVAGAALAHYVTNGTLTDAQAREMAESGHRLRRVPATRRGRARHLVLVGALAVLDAWLARPDAGAGDLLSDQLVLVSGFDIIFFWVARMMMRGLHFTGRSRSAPSTCMLSFATRTGRRCRSPRATSSTRST